MTKKRILAISAVSKVILALSGLTALALLPTPALAFDFQTQSGETAGNPAGQSLYQVEITAEDVGESFPVGWVLPARADIPQLSATAVFEVVELTSNRLVLDVRLSNETASSFQAAITSFGFGITPTATDVALSVIEGNTATFETVVINQNQQNFPGGFKDINVCIFAANNCSGGSIMQGLQSGSSEDAFRLEIAGDFGATPNVSLASFPIKFQTEAGSFELAGAFTEVSVTEVSNDVVMSESDDDDDSESDDDDDSESDDDDEESDDLPVSVSESVYREISARSGVAVSELRIVEARRETWTDGCLGLGGPADSCLQALVPGWRIVAESDEQTWVYRTDESGSVVVLDAAATETRTASVYTETRTETRTEERVTEVTEVSGGTSGSVTAERTEVRVSQAGFSESVRATVLQAIAQQYPGEVTNLEIVEARRKVWSDGCLGLPATTPAPRHRFQGGSW
ncbi:MAG: cistern family PEP-CTERM protein [Leptolyngbyaceae cyanobacterium RM2_2_4]|nr:cistern family PEP-CTERM protein [Leptolyngbyaceae cyanobacterium RM2_2_4]